MLISKQMKKTALKTTKDVVTNKYVLYIVLFIAFMNVLAYLATSNFIGLTLFCLIGFLTTMKTSTEATQLSANSGFGLGRKN